MKPSIVVALGGNAILPAKNAGTIDEQFRLTRETMAEVVDLTREWRVVLTHGNGPIVGNIVIRNEAARESIPRMPLDICGADSQGGIGYMMQQILQNQLRRQRLDGEVVTVVTQVVVDADDPGFNKPTKPIGPFYASEEAECLEKDKGWKMVQDSGRGWRRVVPSPIPKRIVELSAIQLLHNAGHVVIAAGGGGIPVVDMPDGSLRGVEAVIDKDYASVVLALALGVTRLLVVTAVGRVALDFGKPTERPIDVISLKSAHRYLEERQFAAGSMGPKIEAAVWFLESGGRDVCICSPANLKQAVRGEAGTWLTKSGERPSI